MNLLRYTCFAITCLCLQSVSAKEKITVAVASNFYATVIPLASQFTQQTGIDVAVSSGASGVIFAQIQNGAPYDVFLSADVERPQKLEQLGFSEMRATYALGLLALWSPKHNIDHISELQDIAGKIAIANPKLAPYGAATTSMLARHNLDVITTRLVFGNNVNQTYQFVHTGNAVAGFVSYSQVLEQDNVFLLPYGDYPTIEQQLVVLKRSKQLNEAKQFAEFLVSVPARKVIQARGYGVPQTGTVEGGGH